LAQGATRPLLYQDNWQQELFNFLKIPASIHTVIS